MTVAKMLLADISERNLLVRLLKVRHRVRGPSPHFGQGGGRDG